MVHSSKAAIKMLKNEKVKIVKFFNATQHFVHVRS